MRTLFLTVFLLPYVYFGLRDNLYHYHRRPVCLTERMYHLVIVLALITVVPHAWAGNHPLMLVGLTLFVFARSVDEFIFHRRLSGVESDLHAKTHFAFLVFVVACLAADYVEGLDGPAW